MRILIIGLGSIARKHIAALKKLSPAVQIIALRSNKNALAEEGIENIFSLSETQKNIDFCLISNPTQLHFETIQDAIKLKIPLFIEKPSLMQLEGAETLLTEIKLNEIKTYVAFNLRFHPVIQFLKEFLPTQEVIEANVYCGSYLPDWRPNVDYSKSYSAIEALGGGVHLDLIHEIDYSTWLFGYPDSSTSLTRKVSKLKIDTIDFANYHLLYTDKTVNINLNYYRKQSKREIEIVTTNGVVTADLLAQKVTNDNGDILFSSQSTILDTYEHQMKYFLELLKSNEDSFNNFEDSLKNLQICLK